MMQTVDTDIFRNAVALTVHCHCWGNRRKTDISKLLKSPGLAGPQQMPALERALEKADMPQEAPKAKTTQGKTMNIGGMVVTIGGDDDESALDRALEKIDVPQEAGPEIRRDVKSAALLRTTKQLILSPEYEAISRLLQDTRNRVSRMAVPSFFQEAVYLIRTTAVTSMTEYLEGQVAKLEELVSALIAVYPDRIKEAEALLAPDGLFEIRDYPDAANLTRRFGITWNYIAFGVPETLPKELFAIEKAKAETMWAEAKDQITVCLREGFKELVDHLVDRLTVEPGQPKRIFKDTLVSNFVEWLELFEGRNITNDQSLMALVAKARNVMTGIEPDDLRKDNNLRLTIRDKFDEIKNAADEMIQTMPKRSFDFEE